MTEFASHDLDIALTTYANWYQKKYNGQWPAEMCFRRELTFERGSKFMRVVSVDYSTSGSQASRSAYAFIALHDFQEPGKCQFRRGDILKPASWKAPAKNFPRGNVLRPATYVTHSVYGL